MTTISDPTFLQQQASDPEASVWVSASAGSGKTKVLTDRVLRLLLAGVSPSRILCITFTKAAAAEMKNRVYEKLSEWTVTEEGELQKALEKLSGKVPPQEVQQRARQLFALVLEDMPGLRIQTIHAFCQSLLARFPLEAKIRPYFEVLEEDEAAEMLLKAKHSLLSDDEEHDALAQAISRLSLSIGEWGFGELMGTIISNRRVLEQVLAQPGGVDGLPKPLYQALGLSEIFLKEKTSEKELKNKWIKSLNETLLEQIMSALLEGRDNDKAMAEKIRGFLESKEISHLYDAVLTQKGLPRKTLMYAKVAKRFPELHEQFQGIVTSLVGLREQIYAIRIAENSLDVLRLAEALFSRYQTMKQQQGKLDYDDLILYSQQLLCSHHKVPWVLYKLDGGIDHLLLDEAQDTSPEQWQLTRALVEEFFAGTGRQGADERSVFVVGDEKQSIYRFQGADKSGFSRECGWMREKASAVRKEFREVAMATSFRSVNTILQMVDATFNHHAAAEGVVETDEQLKHQSFKGNLPGKVEIWPTLRAEKKEQDDFWPLPNQQMLTMRPTQQLASAISEVIKRWLKEGRWLPNKGRQVKPGDILILVRSRGELVHHLMHALKEADVPVAGLDRMQLSEHIAVQDLMELTEFLLLPANDLALATVLKSPLYGVSEEALFELCYGRGAATVWQRLSAYQGEDTRCIMAKKELEKLLWLHKEIGVYEFYSHVLYALDGLSRFVKRLGEQVLEPLHLFLDQALTYERTHPSSLAGFRWWLASSRREIKRDMEQTADEVRIMTVHGAKGLQAPIVFLPDTTTVPTVKAPFFTFAKGQDALMVTTPKKGEDCALTYALKENENKEIIEEYHRLLYVAMTRAEEELYVCGVENSRGKASGCWYDLMQRGMEQLPSASKGKIVEHYPALEAFFSPEAEGWYDEALGEGKPQDSGGVSSGIIAFPDYLSQKVPKLSEKPANLMPSRLLEQAEDQAGGRLSQIVHEAEIDPRIRGIKIHFMLELLVGIAPDAAHAVLSGYVQQQLADWPVSARQEMVDEVMGVYTHPDYKDFFTKQALNEVPVLAKLPDGEVISGQIDRLIVQDDKILIIDFKTGALPALVQGVWQVPEHYRAQMEAYRVSLQAVYPKRLIETALLYTAGPQMILMSKELAVA